MTDRPLSTRECADCIGVSTDYIRDAISDGKLKAERVESPGKRPFYRITEADFLAFLRLVKWSHVPTLRATGTE